ncbi:glutamine--fructose-6-phosphate transaminase (isomerizing) [Halomonas elongata]|uniref:Glutamine--fructose-6-phosphate aminotransferase [isomerizing] n=1 Tax=Halomonas elongata (strain ATCC 33173 / DSM 2581 / NBRC 15536 / NCIMB 2198 / 1H9) TaxID=768066 RepID=E1VCE9_HALED|nr:glutamine--fructose-6-phosphate transaminase (isomerizing) [Halomonas elongata]WBF18090.1 glutamine--fructose-6-phosphate transaminase (isomerizing) [Halomonas elongata]WPU46941.1 glutamine--fructose-6-phosphate transaminase (isomerizing) [Halomonas elongata DSM 2581]CBV44319.1 glutamine--fructose-6-phosphate aminotransferase (isomerizing) [Halomonas elongata DSM 2581]
MCGIVGAVAQRNVQGILREGLLRLEYRGYDSAGMVVRDTDGRLQRRRALGKVAALEEKLDAAPLTGHSGIAHTRWATHGRPSEENAHPHQSGERLAVVHNGIIENHEPLRAELESAGYDFSSQTDTEVIAHLIEREARTADLLTAVQAVIAKLDGAYALGVIHADEPDVVIGARKGSPLVVGVGIEEAFLASDPLALLQVTDRFIYLEEGDVVRLSAGGGIEVFDASGQVVEREVQTFEHGDGSASKGDYRHFMLKEIHEQPAVIAETLEGRLGDRSVLVESFGPDAEALFSRVAQIHLVACGTSYHAGLVARYWLERYAGIPVQVEVASEYRYRRVVVPENTLFVTLSQSGETADTLAALRFSKDGGYLGSLAICNVPGSSLARESDLTLMTRAGPEIGVASTKAFTTQLTALMLLTLAMGRVHGQDEAEQASLVDALRKLPAQVERVLALDAQIEELSTAFAEKHHALFLGRGAHFPVALEGALKLKEISYIHAEAYPAGELKHGPLALVDSDMPVVSVAPNDELLDKLKSNLQEVRARGGELFVFADEGVGLSSDDGIRVLHLPPIEEALAPILYTLPLQLLSYHVAVLKGTDVDQPRNLAKSVTVE